MPHTLSTPRGPITIEELKRDVIERARRDAGFKHRLLADTKSVLETTYSIELPPDVEIRVVAESASLSCIVLPEENRALADEELDAVVGGAGTKDPTPPVGGLNDRSF